MISPTAPVKPGDVLAGKYRVERVLGAGGVGVVVAAMHLQLGQPVAIKLLLAEGARDPNTVERFLREARAMVRVKSEHIVRVADVGTLATGAPYMVMEYLRGVDLFDHLAARGPLPIDEALDCVFQACEAIAEAHSLGIVHRDLKPANLFLTQRADGSPLVKVLDFGLAKEAPASDVKQNSLTSVDSVMGTPAYMSPEQLRATKLVDARGDVWAVAVILYELLTAKQPFLRNTLQATMGAILMEPAPSLRALRPDVPAELEAAIARALDKNADARTPSISALVAELAPFSHERSKVSLERIANLDGEARPTLPAPGPAQAEDLPTRSDWSTTGDHGRRARVKLLGVVSAMSLAVALGGLGILHFLGPTASTPVAAPVPSASVGPAPSASASVDVPPPPPPASSASADGTAPKKKPPRDAPPRKSSPSHILDTRK